MRSLSFALCGRATMIALVAISVLGCDVNSALVRLSAARQLAAQIHVQFTKAADSANKAVMADTDDASTRFAADAEGAKKVVLSDIDQLKALLEGLGYTDEEQLLTQFASQFAEYSTLDRTILDLAVENTNNKAQQLAFGPAEQAANAFSVALQEIAAGTPPSDRWRVAALTATATLNVREIQVLHAPHIATPEDAEMTRMEQQMARLEASARAALADLTPLVRSTARPKLATATTALDEFVRFNKEITALSRRNTNVRSLALSLNEKGKITVLCENSLRALQEALEKRGYAGTR